MKTEMHLARRSLTTLLTLALVSMGAVPSLLLTSAAAEPPAEWDGLTRVKSKKIDYLYTLPGATLTGYQRFRLAPVQVAFDKNWDPNSSERSPSRRLSKEDFDRIKSTVADEFRKVFSEELSKGGYTLVDEDGEDVLRVDAAIINLYINAPDTMSAGRSRTYTTSTGHMTLAVELRDSETGKLLARAVDTARGRDYGTFQITTSVSNLGDARFALAQWARILRDALDAANGRAK